MKKTLGYFVLLFLIFACSSANSETSSLREVIPNLKVLPIEYGAKNFKLDNLDIIITRANLPSEVAGYGDVYMVMYRQDGTWNLVQYPDHSYGTTAWPYTDEKPVSTVRFFTKLDGAGHKETLYLLKAYRALGKSIPEPSIATFKLYKVQKNKDFGFIEFVLAGSMKTQKKYCNIDLALNEALELPLPEAYVAGDNCVQK